jgi:hypothetical protein
MPLGVVQQTEGREPNRHARWFVVFLIPYVVAMTALRGQFDVRYNDTIVLGDFVKATSRQVREPGFWDRVWVRRGAAAAGADGSREENYRPLQVLYSLTTSVLYFRFGPLPDYFLCFLLLGFSGYLIFLLFDTVAFPLLAWLCAAAYLLFPAVVSPAWNPLAGPQSAIPGAFAAGLWAYLRYNSTGRKRFLVVLAIVCALGPLFKETIGVLPILLLAHQSVVAPVKRPGLLLGLALGAAHGIFPAAAITFARTGEIHLVSIFQWGTLHDHASAGTWRPNFLLDLAGFVPPSLMLASLVSIAVLAYVKTPAVRLTLPPRLAGHVVALARELLLLAALAAIVGLAGHLCAGTTLGGEIVCSVGPEWTSLLALVAIGLYGLLYLDALVAGWFFCLFLPLLRVYFNTTQCGYVAAPLTYLCVAPLVQSAQALAAPGNCGRLRAGLRYGLVGIGLLAFCDNALSVPNAWIAYRETGLFNDHLLPEDIRRALGQRSGYSEWKCLCNTVVVDDAVVPATNFHWVHNLYNFEYGVPPSDVITTKPMLRRVLSNYNCLLVIADYVNPYRHNFWDPGVIQTHFRSVNERSVCFDGYYIDPLRFFVDTRYRSMMGPPDFQDEFAKETCLFRERFSNRFHVYVRDKGPAELRGVYFGDSAYPEEPVTLVREGVEGFNVLRIGERYHAIPQAAGAFDPEKYRRGDYGPRITGRTVEEVRQKILNRTRPMPGEGTGR